MEGSSRVDEVYEMQTTSRLGGTNHDDHDMQMLGRTQQLNVSKRSRLTTCLFIQC